MYCSECNKTFALAQTKWRFGGFVFHADCVKEVVQKLRDEGKNREADELRYGIQPEYTGRR